jgi:poly-gamma-glutamate synthesis protein (capsule biosynthesis protein)
MKRKGVAVKSILSLFLASLFFVSTVRAEMVLTFGGDLNLNQSRGYITSQGTQKWEARATWQQLFAGLVPYLNGHLNFANLETVVSDRTDLPEKILKDSNGNDKSLKYVFRAHPHGVEYAAMAGFNVMSLSNNHSGDYGTQGIRETLTHMDSLTGQVDLHVAGLGWTREQALRPTLIPVRTAVGTYTVAFMAMSGVMPYDYRAGDGRPGVLSFYTKSDFRDAMKALREARADYRILSVHWGREGRVNFDQEQRPWALRALKDGNVDLFLGHHPHRVHPVERVGDRLIFYSLGNYLMVGGASLDKLPNDHNYGLMGRLYLNFDTTKRRLVPQALEALPITEMHFRARPLKGSAAKARIGALNMHSTNQLGNKAVEFSLGNQGGFVCLGEKLGPAAREICDGQSVIASPFADVLRNASGDSADAAKIPTSPKSPVQVQEKAQIRVELPDDNQAVPLPSFRPNPESVAAADVPQKRIGTKIIEPDVTRKAVPVAPKKPVNSKKAVLPKKAATPELWRVFPSAPGLANDSSKTKATETKRKTDKRPKWLKKVF